MAELKYKQSIFEILSDLKGINPLKDLFWGELNYDRVNESLSRNGWSKAATEALSENPILFASGGQDDGFHIIYSRLASEKLLLGHERPVVSRLLRDHPYTLFVFSNESQDHWHFLNVKYDKETEKRRLFRRITIGPEERLRTATERLSLLDVESIDRDLFGISPLVIQTAHDEAFDVEKVQKEFFDVFANLYHKVADDISKSEHDKKNAEKEAQLLLDRMLFLYFIQKKGWLDGKQDYLYFHFKKCWKNDRKGQTYYSNVLYPLFLCMSTSGVSIDNVGNVPFINGGLFEETPSRSDLKITKGLLVKVKNSTFKDIFDNLLEKFNFTVTEDTPFDVEVAIDPEMLGKIFESLILQLEKEPNKDLRKLTGSYYTPRSIVHFMCQEALKEYIVGRLVEENLDEEIILKDKVNKLLDLPKADQLDDDQIAMLYQLFSDNEAKTIRQAVLDCSVCDPAVGSGAFPVGVLHEMVAAVSKIDLFIHGREILSQRNYEYDLKKHIIEKCLYGVDIQEQAVRLCELRLWLSLMVDYHIDSKKPFHEAIGEIPSLPNLAYRILLGDSLLERLFGHVINLDEMKKDAKTISLIKSIQADKQAYFRESNASEKRHIELKVLNKQTDLSERLLEAKRIAIKTFQQNLFGLVGMSEKELRAKEEYDSQINVLSILGEQISGVKTKLEELRNHMKPTDRFDLDKLRRQYFQTGNNPTFMWRVDFAEVFEEKGGFDIVIANPPYVRTENLPNNLTIEYRKAFTMATKQFDLYNLFIEKGIELLKNNGIFCYIMPNLILKGYQYKKLRKFILDKAKLFHIVNYSDGIFEGVQMPTCVLLFKINSNNKTNNNVVQYSSRNKDNSLKVTTVNVLQSQIRKDNDLIFDRSGGEILNLLSRIHNHCKPLSYYVDIMRGLEIGKKDQRLLLEEFSGDTVTVLTGSDIFPWGYTPTRYILKKELKTISKDKRFFELPKIMIRETGSKLTITYDDKGYWTLRTIYCLRPKDNQKDTLFWLLGILNSSITQEIYEAKFRSETNIFPKIRIAQVKQLPVIDSSKHQKLQLTKFAKRLLRKPFDENTATSLDLFVRDMYEIYTDSE